MQYEPMTITFTVTGGNLQNQNFEKNDALLAYPNPVTDLLNLKSSKVNIISIEIYDINGKLIKNQMINANEKELNVSIDDEMKTKMVSLMKMPILLPTRNRLPGAFFYKH